MKQITWDDQWIGYDDYETTAMKKKWASGLCFGGTMIWSVDFETGSGRFVISCSHLVSPFSDHGNSNGDNPNDNAPVTKDGTCGSKHGGTICGDWKDGSVRVEHSAKLPPVSSDYFVLNAPCASFDQYES